LDRGSLDWGWRLAALWTGLLAGPVVWAALLETNYALSYVACEQRRTWMLHLSTAVAILLIANPSISYASCELRARGSLPCCHAYRSRRAPAVRISPGAVRESCRAVRLQPASPRVASASTVA